MKSIALGDEGHTGRGEASAGNGEPAPVVTTHALQTAMGGGCYHPGMGELELRLLVLANVVIPLVFFMAWVYLALHVVFARLVDQANPVLWFFAVVTGPLTRPVRSFMPPGTPAPRVRMVALAVYFALWMVVRALFTQLVRAWAG